MDGARSESIARDATPVDAIEADVRAELETHLALCEKELAERGVPPDLARELARRRFGDVERTVRVCIRERTKGTVMLQRLHLVATLLLLACVAYFGVRSHQLSTAVARLSDESSRSEHPPLEPVVFHRGDRIRLVPTYNQDLDRTVHIAPDGTALLPHLGHVMLAGLGRDEAEALLMERYAPRFEHLDLRLQLAPEGTALSGD